MNSISREEAERFFRRALHGVLYHSKLKEEHWGWSVRVADPLATWDMDHLTRLVLLAHECRYRVEISPSMRALKVAISARIPLQETDRAPRSDGHPTLEEARAIFASDDPHRLIESLGAGNRLPEAQ